MHTSLLSERASEDFPFFFPDISKFLLPAVDIDPEIIAEMCKHDFELFIKNNQMNLTDPLENLPTFNSVFNPPRPHVKSLLTPQERREKIQKFLDKRERRSFSKKVSYECRKKVADNRRRFKGRFVSKLQSNPTNRPEKEKSK